MTLKKSYGNFVNSLPISSKHKSKLKKNWIIVLMVVIILSLVFYKVYIYKGIPCTVEYGPIHTDSICRMYETDTCNEFESQCVIEGYGNRYCDSDFVEGTHHGYCKDYGGMVPII